jgi:hypothetical protein
VGFLCVLCVAVALGLATTLTKIGTVVIVIICPVIFALRWGWWGWRLVPLLNAMLYGGLAFGIAKWRLGRRLAHQDSK